MSRIGQRDRKGRGTTSSGEEVPMQLLFGETVVFSGSLLAIQVLPCEEDHPNDDDEDKDLCPKKLPSSSSLGALSSHAVAPGGGTRWLSEGKKSNWVVSDIDCDPDGGMLEEALPFSAIFRVLILGTPSAPEPCVTLQSTSSGHYLSRPKERDCLGSSKIAKSLEVVNISCHPVWNMSKGKMLFPLYEKEGALFCGPGTFKACFFNVFVLDSSRISSRLDAKDEKKGMKALLKKKRIKRTSVADVSMSSSATPPSSPLMPNGTPPGGEKGFPASSSVELPTSPVKNDEAKINDALSMWLGEEKLAVTGSDPGRPKEKKKKRSMNHPELNLETTEIKRKIGGPSGSQIEEESIAPWTDAREDMSEDDRLFTLLESTLYLLGVEKEKIDQQVKTLKEREHRGGSRAQSRALTSSKQGAAVCPYNVELDTGFRSISEKVVLPLLSQNEKIRKMVLLQKMTRGFLVRRRKEKFMKSLALPPPGPKPKENMKTLVTWANTLYQGGEKVRWCLEIFLLDRVEPLHSIAAMDSLWIDMMTVEALFGAWLDFVRRQSEWQRVLLSIIEKEWPSIKGIMNHLSKYASAVGEAAEDLANQTQAVFETYENIRSLEKFLPYSKNIDVMKRLERQKELKNESFTSAFTAPVDKLPQLKVSLSKDADLGDKIKGVRSEGDGDEDDEEPQRELWTGTSSPGPTARRRLDSDAQEKKRKRRSFLGNKGVRRRSVNLDEKDGIDKLSRKEDREVGEQRKQEEKPKKEEKERETKISFELKEKNSPLKDEPAKDMITDLHLKLEKRRYDEEATAKEEPLKRVVFSGNDGDEGGGVEDKEVRLLFLGEAKPKARTTQVSPMRGRANTPPLMSTPPPMTSGGADAPPNLRRGSIEQHIEQQHQGQKKEEEPSTSTAMSFWKKKEETSLNTQPTLLRMTSKKGSFSTKLVEVKDCPKYLPGFGAGAGLCRRCKAPASQHGMNFEKDEKEKEATEREEEKAKGGEEDKEDKETGDKDDIEKEEKERTKGKAKPKKDLRLRLGPSTSVIGFTEESVLTYRSITLSVLRDGPDSQKSGGRSGRGDEDNNPLEYIDLSAPKPFRWFISLPFEHLQFVKEQATQLYYHTLRAPLGTSEWAKKSHTQAQTTLKTIRDLQTRVTGAMNNARVASTAARFSEIPNFKMPHYDDICGDGPLRMLLVESNVVLSKNGAFIERHLIMFTDLILLLKRSLKDGTWELHDDFGGLIYFGLVKSATNHEAQEGCRTSLKFVDINSKSESIKCIELFGRHVEESRIWCERFTERIEANHLVFGQSIAHVLEQEGGIVPYIVRVTVEELIARGTEEEGIFRLAGNIKRVRYLRVLFNKGMNRYVHPDVLKEEDVTTLGALLKLYLRELPEPLFSYDAYDKMLEAKGNVRAKSFLDQMDIQNKNVLLLIMKLLRLIVLNSEKTKMSAHNLAIVFSPNLFQPRKGQRETPDSMAISTAVIQSLIEYFVRHPEKCTLFEPERTRRT